MAASDVDRLLLQYHLYLQQQHGKMHCPVELQKRTWREFDVLSRKKKLVLYGCGVMCSLFLNIYSDISVSYIVDGMITDLNSMEYIYNKCIYSPQKLKDEKDVVVLITPMEHIDEIYTNVLGLGISDVFSFAYMERSKPFNVLGTFLIKTSRKRRRCCEQLEVRNNMVRSEMIRLYKRTKEARATIETMRNQISALQTWVAAIQKRQTERYKYFLHTDKVVNALIDNSGDEELKKEQISYYFNDVYGNEYILDYDNPIRFNEKNIVMQIREADNPLFMRVTDKYEMRSYLAETLGTDDLATKIYGIWERPEDIDLESLPNSFVLKATNGGDGRRVILVKDKASIDIPSVMETVKGWVGKYKSMYYSSFNGTFKHVKPRIIAEELIDDDVFDYRLWMFHGKMGLMNIGRDYFDENGAFLGIETSFFYPDGKRMEGIRGRVHPSLEIDKIDERLDEMRLLAERISGAFDFLRVDFFVTKKRFYIAELTLTPCGGLIPFDSVDMDKKIGELW